MARAAAKHGIFRRPKLLSDTKIRAAKAAAKPYKISDGQQLYLYVTTAGGKLWRMNYQYDEKERTMSFGGTVRPTCPAGSQAINPADAPLQTHA